MTTDAALASVHFRIQSAGVAVERAVGELRSRQVFRAVVNLRQATQDLQGALEALRSSGAYPDLQSYVGTLVSFYQKEVGEVLRPMGAPALGSRLAASQGNLLGADPVLFPNVAH